MGKLVKFEGEYELGKKPVEVKENVGSDPLTPELIEIDRLITDDVVRTYFPAFASLAALKAAGPTLLHCEILTYGTLVEAEIKTASRDNRNARDRQKKAEQRRILLQIREDLLASAAAVTDGREAEAQQSLQRATYMLSRHGVGQSRAGRKQRSNAREKGQKSKVSDQEIIDCFDAVLRENPSLSPKPARKLTRSKLRMGKTGTTRVKNTLKTAGRPV